MKRLYLPEIEYIPPKNEARLKFGSLKSNSTIKRGRFELWRDKERDICQLAITSSKEVLEEFNRNLHTVRLGGMWKGIEITEEDIKEAREELLEKLEEKW